MTLVLHLTPELEGLLRDASSATGEDPEAFVIRTVAEKLVRDPAAKAELSDAEWQASFAAWLASRKPVNHFVDDSRESIYADRGL